MSTVHLLVVHGVGGHDHLSNLLRTYQSFRSNLTSIEAPVTGEDRIPGWKLAEFLEGATPPVLRIAPRVPPMPGSVSGVCLYEVNYSGFAGVLRRNHRLDLTSLFVGLDLAACAARHRPRGAPGRAVFRGDAGQLGRCLQRVAAVLAAGTVPIVGLPAILFRDYLGTFIATFTRFFEDVATFVLDKNGEQLIAAHFDRAVETIAGGMAPGDRFVLAAHSLGSVVAHNHVVRHWTTVRGCVADTVITFGSPIGLLTWIWLFLDFEDMDFNKRIGDDTYFCWNPIGKGTSARKQIAWFNAVNLVDPIATAFPEEAVDLSATRQEIQPALKDGKVHHRFFGHDALLATGAAHTKYLDDKKGFVEIVLRASGLAANDPEDVPGARTPEQHWAATDARLRGLQWLIMAVAAGAIVGYCWLVARAFADPRVLVFALPFLAPPLTIGVLAFFQRLMFGGPTKRISMSLIRDMPWSDPVAFPYRLRERIARLLGAARDVDPLAASPGHGARLAFKALSFLPTLAAMAVPVAGAMWMTGRRPALAEAWSSLWSATSLLALGLFMLYVGACAGHELVRHWRTIVVATRA